jgi:hypothetical protein
MKSPYAMRKTVRIGVAMLALVTTLFAGSSLFAQSSDVQTLPFGAGTRWGGLAGLGNGAIQTFVTADSSGKPEYVGVYFTAGALSGLPETPSDGRWDVVDASGNVIIPCCGHEVVLNFPETESAIPFEHFVLNWNPLGHPPAGVYDAPHFDLHFYTISNDERTAIAAATAETMCSVPNPPDAPAGEHPVPVSCDTLEQGTMPLPEAQTPPGYIDVAEIAPGMGNHLVNAAAPELMGTEPFTHTWIYGAYAGRLTFYEPMITNAFFEEHNPETCAAISLPEEMPESGYYPSQYCIRYLSDQDAFAVTLESFVEF